MKEEKERRKKKKKKKKKKRKKKSFEARFSSLNIHEYPRISRVELVKALTKQFRTPVRDTEKCSIRPARLLVTGVVAGVVAGIRFSEENWNNTLAFTRGARSYARRE